MHRRRSTKPNLISLDLELARTLRQGKFSSIIMAQQDPPVVVNEQLTKSLKEYFTPSTYNSPSCIQLPEIAATSFEIKSSIIQMLPSFNGLDNEDPYNHLGEFLEICTTFKLQNLTDDALKLRLFPFYLKNKAKYWLHSLGANTITTWAQMQQEFLKKYFPMSKTNLVRRQITSFVQLEDEQFHESWERIKELLRLCPHHQVPKWQIVQSFYEGLTPQNRQMVDASCGGTFMKKSEDEAWEVFENLSENSQQCTTSLRKLKNLTSSNQGKPRTLYEVSNTTNLSNRLDELTKQFAQFKTNQPSTLSPQGTAESCIICYSTLHHVSDCPSASE